MYQHIYRSRHLSQILPTQSSSSNKTGTSEPRSLQRLVGAAGGDGGRAVLVLDGAAGGAAGLDALDDAHGLGVAVGHLAEDDVAAVEPLGLDGGDEELRAVGVGPGVGHAEEEGLGVLELEVLVRELLAVDRLAARALFCLNVSEVGTSGSVSLEG